jgi:prepilin-type N-terminal cleavage/methylation domain-containing protein
MIADPCRAERGYSLIEILIVVAILGLVMSSVFSLYRTHRNSAYSQVEVVEVQQSLRAALDAISRDLRNAGILRPAGTNQVFATIASVSAAFPTYSTNIRIHVASADGRFARVAFNNSTTQGGYAIPAGSSTVTLTVEKPATASSPNVVDGFAVGDNVRLIRPVDGTQNLSGGIDFVITAKNRNATQITIRRVDSANFTAGDVVVNGDMITKAPDAATPTLANPVTIDYYLVSGDGATLYNGIACPQGQKCLARRVNGAAADLIAGNMSSLRFGYIDDNAAVVEASVPADLTTIRAVRVTVQGETATTVKLGGTRSRSLTSVIKLRNRR